MTRPSLILTPKNIRTAVNLGRQAGKLFKKSKRKPAKHQSQVRTAHADDQIHSGIDHQRHKIVLKDHNKKIMVKSMPAQYYRDYNINITGLPGLTFWQEGLYLDNSTAWTQANGGTGNPIQTTVIAHFDVNPNRNITGSSLYAAGTLPAADKYALVSTNTTIDMTSFTTYASFVKIHVLECIANTSDNPLVLTQTSEVNAALGPASITYPGAANNLVAAGSVPLQIVTGGVPATAKSIIGFNASTVANLRKFWKRKKVITVYLAPGGSERVSLEIIHNSVRSRDYLADAPQFIKGTVCLVYEVTGAVVKGQDANQPVVHATPEVGVAHKIKYNFKGVKAVTNRLPTYYAAQYESTSLTNTAKQVNAVDGVANVQLV